MDRTKAGLALCLFAAAVAAVPARAQTALGAPRSYTGVHGVRDLVDLNGDGLLDVVGIQSNDDVVVVLFGDRALGFTLPVTVVGDDLPVMGKATLRADVFNLFNFKGVSDVDQIGELDFNSDALRPEYGSPIGYQRPRYIRLGLDLVF